MLDVSRIQTGKLVINPVNCNLSDLVMDIVDQMKPLFDAEKIPLSFQCDYEVFGEFDKNRIEQVLTNLLINAKNYGEKKPVEVVVQPANEDTVGISVIDHGRGINIEAQERIFDRFERAVNVMDVSGMGLGLFISKQIVLLHRGRILLNSTPNVGSMFTVELPMNSFRKIVQ